MSERIGALVNEASEALKTSATDRKFTDAVEETVKVCVAAVRNGNKIMFAGNGGSAADAQHLAAELVNRFGFDRPGIAAIALTTDTSVITSVSNDYGYNRVFARQVEALGKKGDVLFVISTSGASPSIISAAETARKLGIHTVALTGAKGKQLAELCDTSIIVPSDSTPRIQETHIVTGHILCSEIETALFGR